MMETIVRRAGFLALLCLLCACAAVPRASPVSAAAAPGWLRSELYFSLGDLGAPPEAAQARWQAFLDEEVTPRFPDGLTVLEAYGQWRDDDASRIERLRTRVLVILHQDTADSRAALDALREAWKRRSGDRSVLHVAQPAEVSF